MFDGFEDGFPPGRGPEFPQRRWVIYAAAFVLVFAAGVVLAVLRGCGCVKL
jgi:hypothetical protein